MMRVVEKGARFHLSWHCQLHLQPRLARELLVKVGGGHVQPTAMEDRSEKLTRIPP